MLGTSLVVDWKALEDETLGQLQTLIRFDTTNPPGNEADCIAYIRDILAKAGIPSTILARDPARPNLVARLAGRGAAPAPVGRSIRRCRPPAIPARPLTS